MENLLLNFNQTLGQNIWLAFVMVLVAGMVSSFSPCVLSSLPLIIGYVGNYGKNDKRQAFIYSLVFCMGLIITLTTLGALSAVLGKLMMGSGKWWYVVLGVLMLVVGLQLLGVIAFNRNTCKIPSQRVGVAGAFFLGILGGVFSSPCSTPILVAILAFVSTQNNILLGIALLAVYSIGHCTTIMIAGTSVGLIQKLSMSDKTQKIGDILKILLGIAIICTSFYLFYIGF